MRILKFRFWKDGILQGYRELSPECRIIDMPWEWDKIDQYTGLLDSRGKEIYEGDRYRWPNFRHHIDETGEIIFDEGHFQCKGLNAYGSVVSYGLDSMVNNLEVIGNIYEP